MNWVNIHYTHLINKWRKSSTHTKKKNLSKKSTKFLLLIISTTCFWPWFILLFWFFLSFRLFVSYSNNNNCCSVRFRSWFAPCVCALNSAYISIYKFILSSVYFFSVSFSVQCSARSTKFNWMRHSDYYYLIETLCTNVRCTVAENWNYKIRNQIISNQMCLARLQTRLHKQTREWKQYANKIQKDNKYLFWISIAGNDGVTLPNVKWNISCFPLLFLCQIQRNIKREREREKKRPKKCVRVYLFLAQQNCVQCLESLTNVCFANLFISISSDTWIK